MAEAALMMFRLTPPPGAGQPFEARVVKNGFGNDLAVETNAGGEWKADKRFNVADLVLPQYEFNEWEIIEIEAPDLSTGR